MSRRAVILQPCFLPWRGQYDLLSRADTIVFLDTVQYVRRSWYNRNRILTQDGPRWITVPVETKGKYHAPMKDILISQDTDWSSRMLQTLRHAYGKHPCFEEVYPSLERLLSQRWRRLIDLSRSSIEWGFEHLGKRIEACWASELDVDEADPQGRLIAICREVGADCYLSGPAARNYIHDNDRFNDAGIELQWMRYPEYPPYPRKASYRDSPLSILDLLFNVGNDARTYIWDEGTR